MTDRVKVMNGKNLRFHVCSPDQPAMWVLMLEMNFI